MTKIIYEKITTNFGNEMIKKTNLDGIVAWIPTDPSNSDYQRYLKWLENPEAEETTPTL
jgi:hypothetical protein